MEFVKAYNAATESMRGTVIPVEITIYEDRSFTFITKTPPAAELIKKAAGVAKGSGVPQTRQGRQDHPRPGPRDRHHQAPRPQRQRRRRRDEDRRGHRPLHGRHGFRLLSPPERSRSAPAVSSRRETKSVFSRSCRSAARTGRCRSDGSRLTTGRASAAHHNWLKGPEHEAQQGLQRGRREGRRRRSSTPRTRPSPSPRRTPWPSSTRRSTSRCGSASTPARRTRWSAARSTCPTAPARPPGSWSSPPATAPRRPRPPAPTRSAPTS